MRVRIPTAVKVILGVLASVLLLSGIAAYRVFYGGNDFHGVAEKSLYVSRGESFATVTDSLVSQGIIRDRDEFVFVARVYGGTSRIRVGKYVFPSGVSSADIFLSLRSGRGNTMIPVTIPEGLRVRAQAHLFARAIGIDSARYVELAGDEEFTRSLGIDDRSLEGYLLPETYNFYWEQDEREIMRIMVEQFRKFFVDSLQERSRELGWTTHQVLTMASIIEGEALRNDERPIISGVYWNRLRRGMLLEADPTIQYILEGGPRRVLYADLRIDDPYNTYRYKGLPPGPVNNPGKASILAALYPAQHSYLYFVANGRGGHWFSSTLEEHTRYVRMYRRLRARNHTLSAMPPSNGKHVTEN